MAPRTLIELYRGSLRDHPRPAAFLHKIAGRYVAVSAAEADRETGLLAAALLDAGIRPGDRVAILSETRLAWALADLAILTVGAVTVPIFPSLPGAQIEPLIADAEPVLLFCSDAARLAPVLSFWPRRPVLRTVVLFDGPAPTRIVPGRIVLLDEFRAAGARKLARDPNAVDERAAGVTPDHLASLIYTSGTTGEPKGVMLTHANFTSNVVQALRYLDLGPGDTILSHLPLSHVFERMAGLFTALHATATIAYAESMETILGNLQEVRPTLLISVPRLYEVVIERAAHAARHAGPLARQLFRWAHRTGLAWSRARLGGERRAALELARGAADLLVYRRVRARLGGRMRYAISGGAPLPEDVAHFFHAIGIPILEGYGLTETSPVLAVNPLGRPRIGTVGLPLPGLEVRIAGDGEILVRGHAVMKGYYRRPAETAAVVDPDGWFHTGDIGRLDADGYLCITDRKKDIIVTDGGKNISPQRIEGLLRSVPTIAEAVVIGDRRPHLVALLVPRFEALEEMARVQGIPFASRAELVADSRVRAAVRQEIEARSGGLAPHERVRQFALLDRELTLAGGEITPTLKVKRRKVTECWGDLIEKLYGG